MRVGCPACHAEFSLDTLLGCEASREAVARIVGISLPFGALAVRYIALFRPDKRRLTHERAAQLINDLHIDIERGAITRKGRDWPLELDTWRAGLQAVLDARDKGNLRLPLADHAYLYEILVAMVDKHEREHERREIEAQRHGRAAPGAPAQARTVAEAMGLAPAEPPAPAAPAPAAPVPASVSPVSYAAKVRAQLAARKAEQAGQAGQAATDSPTEGTPGAS